jgi:lipid A 3-O-deacylase
MVTTVSQAATIALAGGYADQTNVWSLAVQWNAAQPFREENTWRITGHLELDAIWLQGRRSGVGGYQNLGVIAATPIARVEWPAEARSPFVEAGIGVSLFSHTELQEYQQFSTAFQFNELIGAGIRFGADHAYELGVRLEHMSNANIKFPNDGITFVEIRAAYHF